MYKNISVANRPSLGQALLVKEQGSVLKAGLGKLNIGTEQAFLLFFKSFWRGKAGLPDTIFSYKNPDLVNFVVPLNGRCCIL
jgi:hypothetical protein